MKRENSIMQPSIVCITHVIMQTVALLLKYDIQTQTHNGVKTMLGLHFVATGKLPLKNW